MARSLAIEGQSVAVEFVQNVAQRVVQLLRGAVDCQVQRFGLVGGRDGVVTLDPRLHLAALVMGAALAAVFVVEMDLDSGQMIIEALQFGLDRGLHSLFQIGGDADAVVTVHQNLHGFLLIAALRSSSAGGSKSSSYTGYDVGD